MQNEQDQTQSNNIDATNETNSDSLEAQNNSAQDPTINPPIPQSEPPKKQKFSIKRFVGKFNVYLLLFIFILIVAALVTAISLIKVKQDNETKQQQITTEPLSQETLDQLRQTDVKIGDPKQILSVESNAIFAGKVLIRDGLEVAGEITSGLPMTLTGLTVSGNTTMNQLQAVGLQVSGAATIQGQLSIQNNLAVNGSGSFGGTLTAAKLNIQDLQINGDLQFTKHIDAGGGTPGKNDGPALGGGGTSSVSGTDTAGTVAINTGSNTAPGCMVTVNFTSRYNGTPHVVITPVGAAGGNVNYYINRSSTNFSICTANAAPAGQSFAFDYIVID